MKQHRIFIITTIGILIGITILGVIYYSNNQNHKCAWTVEQKNFLLAKKPYQLTNIRRIDSSIYNKICTCTIDKLEKEFEYDEILEINKRSNSDLSKLLNQAFIECKKPFSLEINKKINLSECLFNRQGMKKDEGIIYCNCVITNLYNKYSKEHLLLRDSIMNLDRLTASIKQMDLRDSLIRLDLPMMKECAIIARKKNWL